MAMRGIFRRRRNAADAVDSSIHSMLLKESLTSNTEPDEWKHSGLTEGTDSLEINRRKPLEFARAEKRFQSDLPRLLKQNEKLGTWVLYSAQGFVAEDAEESTLRLRYGEQIGTKYFLARVQPEPPDAEVTANWYASHRPKRGR
jgi:hypothetical protein